VKAALMALLLVTGCAARARGPAPAALPASTLLIRDGSVRAELGTHARGATLEFAYQGPVGHPQPLASGELRRQIGLKLRAHDTCNVVYVMWHIEPRPGIEVAVKSNPGLRTHADCRDHGYSFIAPRQTALTAAIRPNTWHTLSATLHGQRLDVSADGALVWQGPLPSAAFAFDGPVGVRSDNGRFHFRFKAISAQ
jgi:hypothetical protein